MSQKLLTKSRFKLALECPAKLYYVDKKEYANRSLEDTFLEALAEGGFQVGELAKCYYKGKKDEKGNIIFAKEVEKKDYDKAVKETNQLLKKKNVIIFEAAFRYKDLFVRTDVLEKIGKKIRILEVKAKSFDPKESLIKNKVNFIKKAWIPYVYDIAFQKYVVENALKKNKNLKSIKIESFLMLADKTKIAPSDGLNQKFLVKRDENKRPKVEVIKDLDENEINGKILTEVPVDNYLKLIYESEEGQKYLGEIAEEYIKTSKNGTSKITFKKFVDLVSKNFKANKKLKSPLGAKCKKCEFKTDEDMKDMKSGFEECWKEKAKFKDKDFEKQLVFNIWNYRGSDDKIKSNYYFIDDLKKEEFEIAGNIDGQELGRKERQWIQVEKYQKKDYTPFIYKKGLKEQMESWKYPLHFIDFETTALAIPFNKGLSPYEGVAFQYSHHIVYKNGKIEHKGQYINEKKGEFPSFDFVRALKNELSQDDGTVFRYAAHENTYLNIIYRQLKNSEEEIPDKNELMNFIKSITAPAGSTEEEWSSPRNMVDMRVIAEKYYYNPLTNGSNSIKKLLPAVLNSSDYLKKKYSKPIYGSVNGIKSLNYKDWTWVTFNEKGNVKDPYLILPPVFNKTEDKLLNSDNFYSDDLLHDGGAAMTAYAKMQFTQMSDSERKKLKEALLKYCELDTFAMVLIWEYWNSLINN